MVSRPRVFSISPGLPFLPTLAQGILDGRFVPETGGTAADPLSLAAVTVLVPTRRAARALAEEFGRRLGGTAAILPRIRPIGDPDEVEGILDAARHELIPEMEPLERRLVLGRLVRFWKESLNEESLRLMAGEALVLPASSADALYLAEDLASFLDEVTSDEAGLQNLAALAPDRLAHWWQLTLRFLAILGEQWPAILQERGLVDRVTAETRRLRREAERLREAGSPTPLILAGSTATAPATLDFMHAVAHLSNGALVLPGLDCHLDAESFDAIDRARSVAAPGHGQYALKRITERLLIRRADVESLCPEPGTPLASRERFLSEAFRPAETTDLWRGLAVPDAALDGLELIEAANEREEALAIAVAMRDALGTGSRTVALTTPDRNLARRVVAELERFGIQANDSAGRPLLATAPGTLTRLALEVALEPGDPVAIVSLLKHPLLRLGMSPARARDGARTIELLALRGGVDVADAAELASLFRRRRRQAEEPGTRAPPRAVQLLDSEERDNAFELAVRLEAALAPLTDLRGDLEHEIGAYARALTAALEALARDENGEPAPLYAGDAGHALRDALRELVAAPETGFLFPPRELPDVARALLADATVRPRGGLSSRVFVWGALEARLQSVDTMILGSLNEGTWPQTARSDAFLSRLMRREIELDPPERRIGLAAHDIWMLMGCGRVILARSTRAGGSPAVASRWLQRILTLAGPERERRLRRLGEPYLHHARLLDGLEPVPAAPRPDPRPPLPVRPDRYSVTEVETLVRDPYAVYARRILRLEALPPMLCAPGAAERGNLYHEILHRFVAEGVDPDADDARERLLAIAREEFTKAALPLDIEAVWWPRMETLAANMVSWERERRPFVAARFTELSGSLDFPDLGVRLVGRADRIDRMRDGGIEIIDYKTGTNPSVKQARTLLAPQLPLEGAMSRLGAFEAIGRAPAVADLLYVRLRERDFYEERLAHEGGRGGEPVSGDDLADGAIAAFRALAAAYLVEGRGYLSRARPFAAGDFSGDYDHLARAREWATAALGEDEEDAP